MWNPSSSNIREFFKFLKVTIMKQITFFILGFFAFSFAAGASETVIADFEDGDISSWSSWQETATIESVDNPASDAVNGSSKVLKLVPDGEWGSIAKWVGDDYVFTAGATKISFKVYASVASTIKLHCDNSASEADNVEKYIDVEAEQWVLLEYDLSDVTAFDYKQLAIQPGAEGTFYFDDITVHYETSTALDEESETKIFANSGSVVVSDADGANVEVYNIAGGLVDAVAKLSGEYAVAVEPGVYIVVVDGETKKLVVQ